MLLKEATRLGGAVEVARGPLVPKPRMLSSDLVKSELSSSPLLREILEIEEGSCDEEGSPIYASEKGRWVPFRG